MTVVAGVTAFLAALALVMLQPLAAKALLPTLGGAPAVWTTSLVAFQWAVCLGYGVVHLSTKATKATKATRAARSTQWARLVPLGALVLPLAWNLSVLPASHGTAAPSFAVLSGLGVGPLWYLVGLSTVSIALQVWLARSFWIYVASNCGSFVGVLAYPFVVEPHLDLADQAFLLRGLQLSVLALMILLAWWTRRQKGPDLAAWRLGANQGGPAAQPGWNPLWFAAPALSSALLMATTTHVTVDLASLPLLWLLPLGLFFLSYAVAFSALGQRLARLSRLAYIPALAAAYLWLIQATEPLWLTCATHLAAFFALACLMHQRLFASRPEEPSRFYLAIALGGALGGTLQGLVVPALLPDTFEYPALCALSLLVIGGVHGKWRDARRLLWMPACVVLLAFVPMGTGTLWGRLLLGVPMVLVVFLAHVPWLCALQIGLTAILLLGPTSPHGTLLHRERSFFGVSRVFLDRARGVVSLVHGSTIHGRQRADSTSCPEPLSYYHRPGPAGRVLDWLLARTPDARGLVVGLGAGALAAYRKTTPWRFYEIDDAVIRIAQGSHFSYVTHCLPVPQVFQGDGRVLLADDPSQYSVMVIDAFGSGSVPMHLFTTEAFSLYLSKLAPDGLLLVHASSRHLRLDAQVVAQAQYQGMEARVLSDFAPADADADPSRWVLVARSIPSSLDEEVAPLRVPADGGAPRWTDSFASILNL